MTALALATPAATAAVPEGLVAELRAVRQALEAIEARIGMIELPQAAWNFLPPQSREWVKTVISAIAYEHGVSPTDMTCTGRNAIIFRPRAILIWVLRQTTDWSLPKIGLVVDRDHTSVLHALRVVERWRSEDPITAEHTDSLAARARASRQQLLSKPAAATNTHEGAPE